MSKSTKPSLSYSQEVSFYPLRNATGEHYALGEVTFRDGKAESFSGRILFMKTNSLMRTVFVQVEESQQGRLTFRTSVNGVRTTFFCDDVEMGLKQDLQPVASGKGEVNALALVKHVRKAWAGQYILKVEGEDINFPAAFIEHRENHKVIKGVLHIETYDPDLKTLFNWVPVTDDQAAAYRRCEARLAAKLYDLYQRELERQYDIAVKSEVAMRKTLDRYAKNTLEAQRTLNTFNTTFTKE